MKPYLLISGDFVQTGGMDVANYRLARHLAEHGHEVHLVAHRVADDLIRYPGIHFHRVVKPLRSSLLGEPLLDRTGRRWAALIAGRGGRVLANGGNCGSKGGNWVHYVHAAYEPTAEGNLAQRFKHTLARKFHLATERRALMNSRLIIANSIRTRTDILARFAIHPDRVRAVYYGTDPDAFHPHTIEEKERSRVLLGLPVGAPVVLFVGSVADERKGFSVLLEAWTRLCADPKWDARLAVAGLRPASPSRAVVSDPAVLSRIHFLGFRNDIPQVLAACDLSVSPARYEAYGLAVHEALCSGIPAFVTANAGVAERYPTSLQHLLLRNAEDAVDLCNRLRHWRSCMDQYRTAIVEFSRELRSRTWGDACAEMADLMEAAG